MTRTTFRAVRGPVGDVLRVTDEEFPAKVAEGYVAFGPPWIVDPDAPGAADTAPRYVIGHEDGRRMAVTADNWFDLYEPLGFELLVGETGDALPAPLEGLLDANGDPLLTHWGARLLI